MRSGFVAQVTYEVDSSGILVTVTPTVETGYKALDISDGGSLVYVPQSLPGASTSAFLVSPYGGGEVLGYPPTQTTQLFQWTLNWWYPANFLGIGYNGQGLILTCPQYGVKYTYGASTVNSSYALTGGMQVYFRPSQLTDFSAPPVDPSLQIRIVNVGDYNNDGTFNWVTSEWNIATSLSRLILRWTRTSTGLLAARSTWFPVVFLMTLRLQRITTRFWPRCSRWTN